jgi:hypothetical protein
MYRQFNIQQFYALPTQCIYVFCVDLSKNSLLHNIKWMLSVIKMACVFTARYEVNV